MVKKRIAWNKGLKASLEVRLKLSEAHKGLKQSAESRLKKSLALKGRKHTQEAIQRMREVQSQRSEEWKANISDAKMGDKNPRYGKFGIEAPKWKGGLTPKNAAVRNSSRMLHWRRQVFERDDYTCQDCNERGGTLHAHHIKAFSTHIELRFELSNGLTLCADCHRKTDNYAGKAIQLHS